MIPTSPPSGGRSGRSCGFGFDLERAASLGRERGLAVPGAVALAAGAAAVAGASEL